MLIINDQNSLGRALSFSIGSELKRLIWKRVNQLGSDAFDVAHFIVVEPGDSLEAVTEALGFSPLRNLVDGAVWPSPDFTPSWEWVKDHGCAFEAVYILSDDGFGWVLLIEVSEGQDQRLLQLCRQYA